MNITNQPVGKYDYFTFTVPPDALGWDLRLTNVTSGNPQIYICRDQLPPGNGYGWEPSDDCGVAQRLQLAGRL